MDTKNYYVSTEWDLIGVPAKKNIKYYPCCTEPYPDITFNISIRRKTLFYTINLLIPCVSINLLTILTFYLPSDSGEKISLSITLLLSLSMFQLLLMELIPATSMKVPMIGKYILFTTVTVSLSVLVTVFTLHMNFRSSATHDMSNWTRKLFFEILPKLLFMTKSPLLQKEKDENGGEEEELESTYFSDWDNFPNDSMHLDENPIPDPGFASPLDGDVEDPFNRESNYSQASSYDDPFNMHPRRRGSRKPSSNYDNKYIAGTTFLGAENMWRESNLSDFCKACDKRKHGFNQFPLRVQKAFEGIEFVEQHHKDEDESNVVKDEWKFVALVIDRLLLWIYISMCLVGGASILLNAPMLYDTRPVIS